MKKAQCTKAFASMLIVFSLSLSFSQAEAFAVKQSDLDWIEQQLETLSIQREESQAKVDELQNRQASVLEQKAALDERNQYTQKQIDLINEQLALMEDLVKQFGGNIVGRACVLAEGDAKDRDDIIYLEPLPLFFK